MVQATTLGLSTASRDSGCSWLFRPVDNFLYVLVLEYVNKAPAYTVGSWKHACLISLVANESPLQEYGLLSVGYAILMLWRLLVPFLIAPWQIFEVACIIL